MNNAIYNSVKQQFKTRLNAARTQGDKLKPGSVAYQKKQAEFFTGAMAAMVAIFDQSPEDIRKIFEDANVAMTDTDPEDALKQYHADLHGKAIPPAWVFGIMRGDDLLEQK